MVPLANEQCFALTDQSSIGRDDVSELDTDDIAGDEFTGFDHFPLARTFDFRFGCEGFHQGLNGVARIALFDEANDGIGQEKKNYPDEVFPIGRFASAVGYADGDDRRSFHHPRERIPHELKELEERMLTFVFQTVVTELERSNAENASARVH